MSTYLASLALRLLGVCGVALLSSCAATSLSTIDGTPFPGDGTKGKAFFLQQPAHLFKNGFQDGKLALVNIIDITSEFGISKIKYGLVLLSHPPGSPIPNPDVGAHVHVGDFRPTLGSMPVDHSGWSHYVRVQNFSDDPTTLLDVFVACEPKPNPSTQFSGVEKMGVSFSNPYTCNPDPNEVYGKLWGTSVHSYGELLSEQNLVPRSALKLQHLRNILERFNATVIDEIKRQTKK